MTPDETVILARYVRALCPQQKFDEYTPDAWHDILCDYQLADARQAAAQVARRQPFVAPAEIADEISKIRASRTHDFVYEPPPGDSDPDYLARLRGQLAATGDGQRPPVLAKELPRRPVAALVASLADSLPEVPATDVAKVRRPGPLGHECPTCRAAIGRPCRIGGTGKERAPHEAREAAAHGRHHDPDTEEQRRRQAAATRTQETAS
ncbi:zinc finger domain-containing protein [Streptomyces flaveolus]|uniref:zinc finger domain-containing protein n=1 Tax=Streptomyces flaveolus TaxID=67297 RepID=UPI00166FE67B|nr:hypothetical protein [Streptomyces flaveolus]GGQ83493.1 hypothetical protein GCM10010216_51650 [Streptomyces flaveolus]